MVGPTIDPAGVVHITLAVGAPTASQVKFRGIPWETLVEGLAVTFNIIGAAVAGVEVWIEREWEGEEEGEGQAQRQETYKTL